MTSCQSIAGSVPPVMLFVEVWSSLPNQTPADEVAGEADEPGIAVGVGGAGLARGADAVEHRALAGAFLDDLVQHEVHVGDDAASEAPARGGLSLVVAVDHVAVRVAHFARPHKALPRLPPLAKTA